MKRHRHVMIGCLGGGVMATVGLLSTQLQAQSSPPRLRRSPLMKPLGLNKAEKSDLVAFLKALTVEPIKFEMPKLPK